MEEIMKNIKSINEQINSVKRKIISTDYVLRGSIKKKMMKCGKKECSCHKDPPKLHGPYYHFTKKIKGKTFSRLYSEKEAEFFMPFAKKYNDLLDSVRRFSELSEEILPLMFRQTQKAEKK